MERIFKTIAWVALLLVVLYFGGYSIQSFSKSVEIGDPQKVLAPLTQKLPEIKGDIEFTEGTPLADETIASSTMEGFGGDDESLPSGTGIDTDESIESSTIPSDTGSSDKKISFEYTRIFKINVDGKELDLSSTTSAEFVKWLSLNYNNNITYIDDKGNNVTPLLKTNVNAKIGKNETTTTVTSEVTTTKNTSKVSSTEANKKTKTKVTYSEVLKDEKQLTNLINSIEIVDKLPSVKGYNRKDYESPEKKFKLNGKKINRNDYAWKTSKYFNEKNFTYTCPYTGKVIKDMDDGKKDNDYGTVDYDHLCPLKSCYIRGGNKWTKEQKNAYAYDQWVAVDVLYSANRSKGDKGPLEYLPDINIEDYCYSWLQICSKYELKMTKKEVDLCKKYITAALKKGEKVEHMCGKN